MHHTVERYNIVNRFLNDLAQSSSEKTREFAKHLLIKLLPMAKVEDLADLDKLLAYVQLAAISTSTPSNRPSE